jgi:hypothetical protein
MNSAWRKLSLFKTLCAFAISTSALAQEATTGGTSTEGNTTGGTTGGAATAGSTASGIGVFVYKLDFKHLEGFNVDFWGGGFVVVPATGGVGSVVLTAVDDGRKEYVAAPGSAAFYFARSRDKRYSVVAMGNGTPGGNSAVLSMQAFGESNHSLTITTELVTLKVKAAKTMRGYAQASEDESSDPLIQTDGTVGFVEFSEMKLEFDEDFTQRLNRTQGGDVGRAFEEVVNEVERRGFVERSDGGTGTGTGTGTSGTSTGGTATAGTATGGPSGGGDGSGSADQ